MLLEQEIWRIPSGLFTIYSNSIHMRGFPGVSDVKESACKAGDSGQYQGQENPLEKGMATHFSILAWIIPWTEEPRGLQSNGSQRVRHNWAAVIFTFTICMKNNVGIFLVFMDFIPIIHFSSVQSLSWVWPFVTPWTAAHQAFLSFTIFWSSLKLMSTESA